MVKKLVTKLNTTQTRLSFSREEMLDLLRNAALNHIDLAMTPNVTVDIQIEREEKGSPPYTAGYRFHAIVTEDHNKESTNA